MKLNKLYKLFGCFFGIVASVGVVSQMLSLNGNSLDILSLLIIVFLSVVFFGSITLPEKLAQWLHVGMLYFACIITVLIDKNYGIISMILGSCLFLVLVYELFVKYEVLYFTFMIISLHVLGFIVIDGSIEQKLMSSLLNITEVTVFLGVISIGISFIKRRYK